MSKKIVRKGSTQSYVASNNGNVIISQDIKNLHLKQERFMVMVLKCLKCL